MLHLRLGKEFYLAVRLEAGDRGEGGTSKSAVVGRLGDVWVVGGGLALKRCLGPLTLRSWCGKKDQTG